MCLLMTLYTTCAQHNLYIGERIAERVKILIGSALEELAPPEEMTVQGRDLLTGNPKKL